MVKLYTSLIALSGSSSELQFACIHASFEPTRTLHWTNVPENFAVLCAKTMEQSGFDMQITYLTWSGTGWPVFHHLITGLTVQLIAYHTDWAEEVITAVR